MEKYLYLREIEWALSWVQGGEVPLKCASAYKKDERGGIYTPDENLIDNSSHDISQFEHLFKMSAGKLSVGKLIENGKEFPSELRFDRKIEDGLVLCLANRRSNYIAKKLKKKACVKIIDVDALKNCLDEQIGIISKMDACKYTQGHLRNHFLKSSLDSWQEEFRLFWPHAKPCVVNIPSNIALHVPIRGNYAF